MIRMSLYIERKFALQMDAVEIEREDYEVACWAKETAWPESILAECERIGRQVARS